MSINPATYPIPTPSEQPYNNDQPRTSTVSRKKRGVAFPADLWPQHSTLKISLIGMTPEQEQFTKNNVNKWAPHVNLKFEFTHSPDADIRIAADNNSYGGSSTVGVNAKKVPAHKPTMFIGFENGLNAKTSQTVAHEFGHALGLKHEHQHPYRALKFNDENVYKEHDRYHQPRQQADEQILKTFDPRQVYFSQYDPRSIMHYGMPGEYFTDNMPTPENYELSATDIQFISALYPKGR